MYSACQRDIRASNSCKILIMYPLLPLGSSIWKLSTASYHKMVIEIVENFLLPALLIDRRQECLLFV